MDVSLKASTNAALTADQIRQVYEAGCGASVASEYNWWKLGCDALDDGSGDDDGTIVGDIIYSAGNEFTSRLTFLTGTAVVADSLAIAMNDTKGLGILIQAA